MDESKFHVFNQAMFLTTDEVLAAYITEGLQEFVPDRLLTAVATAIRTRSSTSFTQTSGMERQPVCGLEARLKAVLRDNHVHSACPQPQA